MTTSAFLTLGELCSKIGSGATPLGGSESYKAHGISLIRSLNIHDCDFRVANLARIDDEQAAALANVEVRRGDVLLNITGASVARCCVVLNDVLPARVNQHVSILRPRREIILPQFLAYLLVSDSIKERLLGIGNEGGATRQALTKAQLQAFGILVPPLSEQERIVTVLGSAFEGLTRAQENAETNMRDTEELLRVASDSLLKELSRECPTHPPLERLCTARGITYGVIKLGDHVAEGVPCLRTSNVRTLAFELDGMKRISASLSASYGRTILEGGEVLVNVRGTLGGVCVVAPEMAGWNISREVAMVAVDDTKVDADFVAQFVATSSAQAWLGGVTKGAAYAGINLSDLRRLPIPLPSRNLQAGVTAKLGEMQRECWNAAARYRSKLLDIYNVRQSLLRAAFSGNLG